MRSRHLALPILALLLLSTAPVLAATPQDFQEIGPRGATPIPADARFAVLSGGPDVLPRLIRLDKITGRTWQLDRNEAAWEPLAVRDFGPAIAGSQIRFQLLCHDRRWYLLDTKDGRCWQLRPGPVADFTRWRYLPSAASDKVLGWLPITD
jgi:hypothetical protein